MKQTLFGIPVEPLSKKSIREKIKKYLFHPTKMLHIVSLNPENIVLAQKNPLFKKVLQNAPIKIIDGAGVGAASLFLGAAVGERITGVDLMEDLIIFASQQRLRVVLIGGKENVAERVCECQKQRYPELECRGVEGIRDITKVKTEEEKKLFSIVTDYKPHLVFVAFGSPFQELWIDRHGDAFHGMVCMGVGGTFDYLSGSVVRAPILMRRYGLEWLFRLVRQPWRIKRQMRLAQFMYLTIKEFFLKKQQKIISESST